MKVIIVEDDLVLTQSYEYYFESYLDFDLVGSYSNVFDALDDFENTRPDIIVSDVSMPMMNGIEGVKLFRKKDPEVKVIIISVHDDYKFIKGAFENMVNGYLTKPINKVSLYEALNSVKYHGAKISDDVAKKVISTFKKKEHDMFSDRENEIVALLSQGETYKTIAESLFITPSTVNFHVQNIYLKLNVNSKSEALAKIKELFNDEN